MSVSADVAHRMDRTRALLTVVICFVGSLVAFALAVAPYDYGLVESVVLAVALVLVLLFNTVLDDAFTTD